LKNKKLVLAARPSGLIKDSDFDIKIESIPDLSDGEILIKTMYLSLAPVRSFT